MIDEEKYNSAVMQAAILDWVMDSLTGNEVCEFGESFPEVAAAMAVRQTLERIVRLSDSEMRDGDTARDLARNTLQLLGNF